MWKVYPYSRRVWERSKCGQYWTILDEIYANILSNDFLVVGMFQGSYQGLNLLILCQVVVVERERSVGVRYDGSVQSMVI